MKIKRAKLDILRKEIQEELGEEEDSVKLPEPELAIDGGQVYVKRPWVQEYLFKRNKLPGRTESKRELTEQEKLERSLRRQKMEIERRRALKRALKRAKQERLNALEEEGADGLGVSF
jgi:hypothetical protein